MSGHTISLSFGRNSPRGGAGFIDAPNRPIYVTGVANNFATRADYMEQSKWRDRCKQSGTDWAWTLEGGAHLELDDDQAAYAIPTSLLQPWCSEYTFAWISRIRGAA